MSMQEFEKKFLEEHPSFIEGLRNMDEVFQDAFFLTAFNFFIASLHRIKNGFIMKIKLYSILKLYIYKPLMRKDGKIFVTGSRM